MLVLIFVHNNVFLCNLCIANYNSIPIYSCEEVGMQIISNDMNIDKENRNEMCNARSYPIAVLNEKRARSLSRVSSNKINLHFGSFSIIVIV